MAVVEVGKKAEVVIEEHLRQPGRHHHHHRGDHHDCDLIFMMSIMIMV